MSKREEFIDKTDRRKIPKLSYSIEYICDRIVDWYYHVETTKIAKLSIHDNKINYMYEPFPYRKLIHLFKCYPFEENDISNVCSISFHQTPASRYGNEKSLSHHAISEDQL